MGVVVWQRLVKKRFNVWLVVRCPSGFVMGWWGESRGPQVYGWGRDGGRIDFEGIWHRHIMMRRLETMFM